MDLAHKLKRINERASKETFAFRFYKSGDMHQESEQHDRNFNELEWFNKGHDQISQSGGVNATAAQDTFQNMTSDRSRKHSSQIQSVRDQAQPQQPGSILQTLEDHLHVLNNTDLRIRQTKIVCTLGRGTKELKPIQEMIERGMDIARLNMNYFELYEQNEIVNNVKKAAKEAGKNIGIMVDLKGPLIRTLGFKNMYSVNVLSGQEIRISSNQAILGDEGMFVIDYNSIDEHLEIGDKILVDYGGVVLTVIGFEDEEKYLKRKQKAQELLESPAKEEKKSAEKQQQIDSNKKLHHRKRKNSFGDDEQYFNKEIQELANEDSQDEEDNQEQFTSSFTSSQQQEKKDYSFPRLPKLDSSARVHHQAAQELKNERNQFEKVVFKSGQGFGAYQFTKKADKARQQQTMKMQTQLKNHHTTDLQFSSGQSFGQEEIGQNTNNSQANATVGSRSSFTAQQPHQSSLFQGGSSLLNYQMKRMSTDDRDYNHHHHLQHPSQFARESHQKLGPSQEYMAKKRMSRDEFLKDKFKLFKGQKNKKNGPKSRQSLSPTSRNLHSHHDNSFSVSESDNMSLLAHPGLDKNHSNQQQQEILDLNVPLYQKDKLLVICRVENDGQIKENKPIYIPRLDWYKDLKLSVLGPKDIKVLQNSIQQGVECIAVSFVESREDIIYVKKVLGTKGQHIKLLAKIQSQKALQNFSSILEISDGIIIARGYLGIKMDIADVVFIQKRLIKECNLVGKPVLLSTQIMESMVTRLLPSRSEVVDISNAVFDGIDCLILSPETSIGTFYNQATEKMSEICFEAERHMNFIKRYQDQELLIKTELMLKKTQAAELWTPEEAIASCAVKASFDVKAHLIIVFTHTGITARKIAKHKPKCPVLAVTPNEWAARGVLLHRGVYSMLVGSLVGSDTLINKVLETAIERKYIKQGDFIVITSGLSGTVGSTNLLKIIKV